MAKTLVLYDGRSSSAERVAVTLGCIIGKVRIRELGDAPESPESFRNVLFVCNFYGALTASRTRDYVAAHREALSACRIALVGVGFSDVGFVKYVGGLEAMLRLSEPLTTVFLRNEKMTVEVGAHLSRIFGKAARPIRANALLESIQAFASAHRVMALATANEDYVRCTPVDYSYVDGKFYIVTEGGMKFRSILRNNHVSLAVFEGERQPDGLLDVLQVEGTVEVLPGDSPIAHREAAARIQRGGMDSGEIFVLCVTPQRYRISSAAFAAAGFDADQTLEAEDLEALSRTEDAKTPAPAEDSEDRENAPEPENTEVPEATEDGAAAGFVEGVGDTDFTDSLELAEAYADASQAEALLKDKDPMEGRTEEDFPEGQPEEDPGTLADAEAAFALEAIREEDGGEPEHDETSANEAPEEEAVPDLQLAAGVDWVNFSVGDFDVPKEKAADAGSGENPASEDADAYADADAAEEAEEDGQPEDTDETARTAGGANGFYEGLGPVDERVSVGTVGSDIEAVFAEDDEEDGPGKEKEPFADAEALASRELLPDEEELFDDEEDGEKPKKEGFLKRLLSRRKKKEAAKEETEGELPKTMLSAQRKLSRKDEAGPSRYVYNADEDDDFYDDYDEYDEFDKND